VRAAEVAVGMFKENFQREGFFGSKWKQVERRLDYTMRDGKKVKNYARGADRKRKILTGRTGDLGRSIKKTIPGDGAAKIYSDVPYAEVHNSGLRAGRGNGFIMPKRPFIGDHKELNDAVRKVIKKGLDEVMKKYK
jgi:phage gpG-like protein